MSFPQRLVLLLILGIPAAWLLDTVEADGFLAYATLTLATTYVICAALWCLHPQWSRLTHYSAGLGLAGVLISLFAALQLPLQQAAILLLTAVIALLISGIGSLWRADLPKALQAPSISLSLVIKTLLDEIVMGYFVTSLRFPKAEQRVAVIEETLSLKQSFETQGCLQEPAKAHPKPVKPTDFSITPSKKQGQQFSNLQFPSAFPTLDLPGSDRWQAQSQTVRARVFEHADGPRPWLMCIHGYRMGWLPLDFQLFSPGWLHHKLGFNLIMPILPLHGSRRLGPRSGDGLFDGNIPDMTHAILQGIHDLRSLLAWLRVEREAQQIAVLGYSLGGLHAALLASLESELAHVIAGIPLVDISSVMGRHAPSALTTAMQEQGLSESALREVLGPISPLALRPALAANRLAITAAIADRLVPAEPIQQLSDHWRGASTHWYDGSHLSVRRETSVRNWLLEQWSTAGLLHSEQNAQPQEG